MCFQASLIRQDRGMTEVSRVMEAMKPPMSEAINNRNIKQVSDSHLNQLVLKPSCYIPPFTNVFSALRRIFEELILESTTNVRSF